MVCLGDYIYERLLEGPRKDPRQPRRDVQTLTSTAQVRALPLRPNLLRVRGSPDARDLGRPRGRGQLGRRPAGRGHGRTTASRSSSAAPRLQAFFEHMPRIRVREERDRIYGQTPLGANAELFLLDQRHYRDDQSCGDQFSSPCPEPRTRPHVPRRRAEGVVQGRARALAGELEGGRQPGDGDVARRARAATGSTRTSGTATRPSGRRSSSSATAGSGRHVHHRRHPLVLRRQCDAVGPRGPGEPAAVATEFVGGSITSQGIAASRRRGRAPASPSRPTPA